MLQEAIRKDDRGRVAAEAVEGAGPQGFAVHAVKADAQDPGEVRQGRWIHLR